MLASVKTAAGATVLAALLGALMGAGSAHAQDAKAGRTKAAQACGVCHGEFGIAAAPDAPHLAGQSVTYLVNQLRAYRSGSRRHEVMGVIAKTLSDGDITMFAEWYASIRIEVVPPK